MKIGDEGEDVAELQQLLKDIGYNIKVDGDFGSATDAAVRDFQHKKGLKVDGWVGENTLKALPLKDIVSKTQLKVIEAARLIPDRFKVKVVAVRDYKKVDGSNKVGAYDDAIFVLAPGVNRFFKSNSDPSRLGWNPGVNKPFAQLSIGLHYFIKGYHKGRYPAFRQPDKSIQSQVKILENSGLKKSDADFKVIRSYGNGDSRNYTETGYYAINIHKGTDYGTSSWGCQTLTPSDWEVFKKLTYDEMIKYKQLVLPYNLIQGPIA